MIDFGYSEDNIPYTNRLPRWEAIGNIIRERNYKAIAEIGVASGKTAFYLLQNCSLSAYFLVDPSFGRPYIHTRPDIIAAEYYQPMICMNMTSEAAAVYIADNSLDLVFIDANHDYSSVKLDILSWLPKMKVGSVMCGHDYCNYSPGVVQAVTEIFTDVTLVDDCAEDILGDSYVLNSAVWIVELPDNLK